MERFLSVLICVALFGCGHSDIITYQPNPNDNNAATTIQQIIKSQPPAYATIPYEVSAKSDCLELLIIEERSFSPIPLPSPLGSKYTANVFKVICYENIGQVLLNKSKIWYVEIYDRLGYWVYTVYCYDEIEAKRFIDALYTMIGSQ